MNNNSLAENTLMTKLKHKIEETRQKRRKPAPVPTTAAPASSMLTWLIALTFIVLAGAGSYAIFHYYVLTRIPHAMVGTWVVMEVKVGRGDKSNEALKGGRMQFRRDGTMILETKMDGKYFTITATVEVEDETLRITTVNPKNKGEKATDVHAIRTLEGDRFVIEDRKGTVLMMERLRE
jgi:hypothetical protein